MTFLDSFRLNGSKKDPREEQSHLLLAQKQRIKMIATYPGTFDPVTKGHEDLIRRASKLFLS